MSSGTPIVSKLKLKSVPAQASSVKSNKRELFKNKQEIWRSVGKNPSTHMTNTSTPNPTAPQTAEQSERQGQLKKLAMLNNKINTGQSAEFSPFIPESIQKTSIVPKIELKSTSRNVETIREKTPAEKAFQLVKKTRQIVKLDKRVLMDNKERLEMRNRMLSKQPDHFDLAKTSEKIQKGY